MRAWAKDIPKQSDAIKQAIALEYLTNIVPATPVLTGEARSNYIVTAGMKDVTTVRAKFDRSGDISLRAGRTAIASAPIGQPIHITNNLPYWGLLNRGSSTQAPAGFAEAALTAARALIGKQVIRYRGY